MLTVLLHAAGQLHNIWHTVVRALTWANTLVWRSLTPPSKIGKEISQASTVYEIVLK